MWRNSTSKPTCERCLVSANPPHRIGALLRAKVAVLALLTIQGTGGVHPYNKDLYEVGFPAEGGEKEDELDGHIDQVLEFVNQMHQTL
jgi:hypothetical protein